MYLQDRISNFILWDTDIAPTEKDMILSILKSINSSFILFKLQYIYLMGEILLYIEFLAFEWGHCLLCLISYFLVFYHYFFEFIHTIFIFDYIYIYIYIYI